MLLLTTERRGVVSRAFLASLTLTGLCGLPALTGCDGIIIAPPPQQTDVAVESGKITAPGSTIVSAGNTHSGDSGLFEDSLVGIVRDGKGYLYHPALGNVDLSEETSRQALGAYFAERLGVGKTSTSALRQSGFAKVSARSLDVGQSKTLANGLNVTRTSNDRYRFDNSTRRWALVKGPDGPVYLLPAIAEGVPSWARSIARGSIQGGTATITVGEADVETYASMASIATLFIPSLSSGLTIAQAMIDGVTFSDVMDHAREALDHDAELFLTLNTVEFLDLFFTAVEKVSGVLPFDCINPVVLGADALQLALRSLLTDGDATLVADFIASRLFDLAGCACEGTLVCIIATVAKDLLLGIAWDVQVKQGALQSLRLAAYEEVEGICASSGPGSLVAWPVGSERTAVPCGSDFVALSAGVYCLALKADGAVVAWGGNWAGQTDVPSGKSFVAVAAANFNSLALESDGSLVQWGNHSGTPSGKDFVAIAADPMHAGCLALRSDGSLVAWGGSTSVAPGNDFVAIAAGVALRSDGSLVALENRTSVPPGNDFVAVSGNSSHCLALRSEGSLVAWGENQYGQSDAPSGNDFVAVAAGIRHSLALRSDGSLVAWGDNSAGQCDVPSGSFRAIAAGSGFGVAIRGEPSARDSDGDGVPDNQDGCPNDPNKTSPGNCGCGEPETPGCGGGDGRIYFMGFKSFCHAVPDGSDIECGNSVDLLDPRVAQPAAMAVDPGPRQVYWLDYGFSNGLYRANLDGTGAELLTPASPWQPAQLALDTQGGRIYWGEDDGVHRANLDGSDAGLFIGTVGDDAVLGVALELSGRKIYWTSADRYEHTAVWRANLDRSDREVVVETPRWPVLIALDVPRAKIYWASDSPWQIWRADFGGTNTELIVHTKTDGTMVGALAVDAGAGKLYWAESDGGTTYRANLDGSNKEVLPYRCNWWIFSLDADTAE